MDEDKILKERKEKLIRLFKKDKLFSAFAIIALASFLFAIFTRLGISYIIGIFSPLVWIVLAILSGFSAILVFYNKKNLSFYPMLAWIVFISTVIRTKNISGLRDITTGGWALGPDLDPWLFLRWGKYIVENGSLMTIDMMRYVPVGFSTKGELILHPYMIAWFHKLAAIFGSTSVTQSAAIYPVFFFAITIIAFFFLTRLIFIDRLGNQKASLLAVIASLFLTIMPSLLPRTIAGIPEKESAAFFFLFMSFYLFLKAWKSTGKNSIIFAALAGIFTAGMSLVWGGFIYIFYTLSIALTLSYILFKIDKEKIKTILVWMLLSFGLMMIFSSRYSLSVLLQSSMTSLILLVLVSFGIEKLITKKKIVPQKYLDKYSEKIVSLVIVAIIGIIIITIIKPLFIFQTFEGIYQILVQPITDRFGVTVAENRQPYFSEWTNSFGPVIKGIPFTFWLMIIGSVALFASMTKFLNKKEKTYLTASFVIMLLAVIFSRYNPSHLLNGDNAISKIVYFGGIIIFIACSGLYYYKYKKEKRNDLKGIDFSYILLFSLFILGVIAARSSVRTVMVLVPTAAIMISYLIIMLIDKFDKKKIWTVVALGLVVLMSLTSAYYLYGISTATAQSFVPSAYNQQWQKSMSWVRESTPENSVFSHWWDYGYWVQSIGERATVLDGGNAIVYWNHLMGRYVLTGSNEREALEFLYAHNVTHHLIDSTDIGKYTAFSSIGSDINYDRRSWISTFLRDNSRVSETKNGTLSFYVGGFSLDEDIVYNQDGNKIFLPGLENRNINNPGEIAGVGAVAIEIRSNGEISQPAAIYVYQGRQYELPLRYAFYNGTFYDFEQGVESGVYIMPRVAQTNQGVQVDNSGALLFLSNRTVKSQLARLYLYGEEDEYFKLAHSQDDIVVENLKAQSAAIGEFIYFNGFRGPIKIWEVSYPEDINYRDEFAEITYPDFLSRI